MDDAYDAVPLRHGTAGTMQPAASGLHCGAYNELMKPVVGCLFIGTQLSLGWSQSFESDLSIALRGSPLSGTEFHRTVLTVMAEHKLVVGYMGKRYLQRTLGDSRGRLLWVNRGGFIMDDLYLIWKVGQDTRVQMLARPKDQGWQVFRPGYLRGSELVFCDNAYSGANWLQPCVRVYEKRNQSWKLKQNLYAAKGKEARGELNFAQRDGQIDLSRADGTVRAYPTYLRAPHVGPLLVYDIRFERIRGVYRQTRDRRIETPLAALEDLAHIRAKGKREIFDERVPKALRGPLWDLLSPGHNLLVSTGSNIVDDESPVLRIAGCEIRFVKRAKGWTPLTVVELRREPQSG